MSQSADPFLLQKVEFLEMELQESRERESKLKKTYDSLLGLLNPSSPAFRNQTESELGKVTETYERELSDLRRKSKEEKERLESEIRTLKKRCSELELDLKHASVTAEREKLEMKQKLSQVEADKAAIETSLRAEEAENSRLSLKGDISQRLLQLAKQFEQFKDFSAQERGKLTADCEAKVTEISSNYAKEKSDLLSAASQQEGKIAGLMEKLRQSKAESDGLRREVAALKQESEALRSNPRRKYQDQVEEDKQKLLLQVQSLQGRIQTMAARQSPRLKLTPRDNVSDRPMTDLSATKVQLSKAEKTIEILKGELAEERKKQEAAIKIPREERPLQVSNSMCTARQSWGEELILGGKERMQEAEEQLRAARVETAQLQLQKERVQIDLEKVNIETKQMKLDWSVERERLTSDVTKLKNEVKFLIGKLVKAKGKLAVEGELNETLRKSGLIDSFRSKSVMKGRITARGASPQRSCVSPLNLSCITRAESPCMTQSIDAL